MSIDKSLRRTFFARLRVHPGVNERKLNVAQTVRARQQVERLKDKSDFAISNRRQLVIIHFCHVSPVEVVTPRGWRIETTNHVHERRFAAAARAHHRDVFVTLNLQRDAAQCVHGLFAHYVILSDVLDINDNRTERPD